MITDDEKELLKRHEYEVECEDPLEIRHPDGSFASQAAARLVIQALRDEQTDEKKADAGIPSQWFAKQAVALVAGDLANSGDGSRYFSCGKFNSNQAVRDAAEIFIAAQNFNLGQKSNE